MEHRMDCLSLRQELVRLCHCCVLPWDGWRRPKLLLRWRRYKVTVILETTMRWSLLYRQGRISSLLLIQLNQDFKIINSKQKEFWQFCLSNPPDLLQHNWWEEISLWCVQYLQHCQSLPQHLLNTSHEDQTLLVLQLLEYLWLQYQHSSEDWTHPPWEHN